MTRDDREDAASHRRPEPQFGDASTPIQRQALWWAKFVTFYGIPTCLAAVLLAVVLGFLPAPMFSGSKTIESDTYGGVMRIETSNAMVLMRVDSLRAHLMALTEAMDRVACAMMLTPEKRQHIKSRLDFDAHCGWLRTWAPPDMGTLP